MRANPGGNIPPEQVIGRDALIERLWRTLARQSVLLTAERRMGKTSVIRKMCDQAPAEVLCFYQDLEGVGSELEFVERVFERVDGELSRRHRVASGTRQLLREMAGLEIGGVIKLPERIAPDWKRVLARALEDLHEQHTGLVIFFWDEMPLMLHNLARRNGEAAAMQVLDHLRALRQQHPRLRMVFTGSIGLHNVVTALRRAGHANDATNDMHVQDVPPLRPADAADLARRLLLGERLRTTHMDTVAHGLATAVDNIPYFIHHVVDDLAQSAEAIDHTHVENVVRQRLTDAMDAWHLRYYEDRIGTYYLAAERRSALALLDVLAISDHALSFTELFNLLKTRIETEDEEAARQVLVLLQQDHYLYRETDGSLRFRFPLIQRFWRLHRGLGV